jgi:hypothetical protein
MTKTQFFEKIDRKIHHKPKPKMTKTKDDTAQTDKEFIKAGEEFIDEHIEAFKKLAQ